MTEHAVLRGHRHRVRRMKTKAFMYGFSSANCPECHYHVFICERVAACYGNRITLALTRELRGPRQMSADARPRSAAAQRKRREKVKGTKK